MRTTMLFCGMLMAFSIMAGEELKYDVTGLPQVESVTKAPVAQPVKVMTTKETRVTEGSLESFGATGLGK